MTRKRFVKLLMAQGVSRNSANAWASLANSQRPYSEVYNSMHTLYNPFMLRSLGKMLNNIYLGLGRAFRAMGASLTDVGNRMCESGGPYDE